MEYRTEISKIYKKLDSLAQQGEVSIFDYYLFIDDLIDEGKYSLLLNVMATFYNMDITKFRTIDDFKKNSFKHIRSKTVSNVQKNLNGILKSKLVYNVGTHYYDTTNNKYLGDIIEVDPEYSNNLHLLESRPWTNPIVNLNVVRGLSSAIFASIPKFGSITGESFFYVTQSQVVYQEKVYECINAFTWSKTDQITPTYSQYFTQSILPNFTVVNISDKKLSLNDKYALGIDILKL